MNTTTTTAEDRTAADTTDLLVYRPLDPAWGDADALDHLRRIRAARTRADELALEQARAARRAEAARLPVREGAARGRHRDGGLRLFGHRFA